MNTKKIPNFDSHVKKAIGETGYRYMFSVIHRAIALAGNTSVGLVLTFVDPGELKNHPQKLLLSNPRKLQPKLGSRNVEKLGNGDLRITTLITHISAD